MTMTRKTALGNHREKGMDVEIAGRMRCRS
jgi:hypothetical protein